MRYLVLTDIHSNLEALEAVLRDAGDFDAVLFLGDLVGYGANPNECVDRVRELPNLTSLAGNHDWAALGKLALDSFNGEAAFAAKWTRARLRSDVSEFLRALKPSLQLDGFALAHGSPRDPTWEYMTSDYQGPPNFEQFEGDLCFNGHTHVPRVFVEESEGEVRVDIPKHGTELHLADGTRRILNPGGVGQPRDGDPRAAYGLWEADSGTFTFRRVAYDIPEAQRKIREAGLPAVLASRLPLGM